MNNAQSIGRKEKEAVGTKHERIMLKHCKFIFREGNLMNRLTGVRWRDPLKGLLPNPSESQKNI